MTEDRSSTATPLSRMRIASRAHGGFTPPHSNQRHFHRFPSPAAAPKGPAFGRLEKSGRRPSAFGRRPAGGRAPKRGPFFATISLTRTCSHKFRDCHSDEETIPFFATRGSVQRSATAQSAEATVGRKKSERSPERQPRVQKSRKKSSFLSKSSGKIGGKWGGFRDGGHLVQTRSALADANREPCTRGLHPPALQ